MSVSYLSNKQRKCDFERPSLYRTQALQIIKIKYYRQAVKVNCKKYGYYGVFISHTTLKKISKNKLSTLFETTENPAKNSIIQEFYLLDREVKCTLSFGGYWFYKGYRNCFCDVHIIKSP